MTDARSMGPYGAARHGRRAGGSRRDCQRGPTATGPRSWIRPPGNTRRAAGSGATSSRSDVAAAADFYGKVFGWTFETYVAKTTRHLHAGAGPRAADRRHGVRPACEDGDVPPRAGSGWCPCPTLRRPQPQSAPTAARSSSHRSRWGTWRNCRVPGPGGRAFGAVRSKHGDPADYLGDVNEWAWLDLWTGRRRARDEILSGRRGLRGLPRPAARVASRCASRVGGYARQA